MAQTLPGPPVLKQVPSRGRYSNEQEWLRQSVQALTDNVDSLKKYLELLRIEVGRLLP